MYVDSKMADASAISCGQSAATAGQGEVGTADVSVVAPDGVQTIYVPKVEARLSAGTGSLEVSDNIKGYFGFRSDWLHRKGCPTQMVLMSITGDSMRPTLENGDLGVLVYGDEGEGTLKRYLQRGNCVVLQPFNPAYNELVIKGEDLNRLHIAGRVVETKAKW